jgi:Flp pilus assembly protein TadG
MAALIRKRTLRGRAATERGAEIIELALVTPILALIIAALFDFGFLFRNWEVVTNAAREGARMGVLPSYACDGSTLDIEQRVDAYMTGAGILDDGSYSVAASVEAVNTDAGTFSACVVTVELTQPLPSLGVISAMVGGSFGDVPVKSQAVMRTETQATP